MFAHTHIHTLHITQTHRHTRTAGVLGGLKGASRSRKGMGGSGGTPFISLLVGFELSSAFAITIPRASSRIGHAFQTY